MDTKRMFDGLKVGMVASNTKFDITYINKRGTELFKALLSAEDLVGKNMAGCHKPETMEKLKIIYQEFRERKRSLHYYVMDGPDSKATIVQVPFYDENEFAGVVEFIFESALG